MAYKTLGNLFPKVSRTTRYRWRVKGKVRKPDIVINGIGYYDEDRPLEPPADAKSDTKQDEDLHT
jgi:hypothetical protein